MPPLMWGLLEVVAKLTLLMWALNYGARGGYAQRAVALLVLLIILSGMSWW